MTFQDFPRWVRSSRAGTAARTDGISVGIDRDRWVAIHPTDGTLTLSVPPLGFRLEDAISEVDAKYPPPMWTLTPEGAWQSGVWSVFQNGDLTWSVYRNIDGLMEAASRQAFQTADRARRWSELRFDRGTSGLRGPKPRAGFTASAKLPDVRVTVEERNHTIDLIESNGLTYSEFVRAALMWMEEHVGTDWIVYRREDGTAFFEPKSDE